MDLDATDRDLLAALLEDARISQRGLAKRVGVAQGTITNRLRRLEEMGVIKGYTVLLDAESIGWTMTVITGLRIQKGSMIDLQQQIAADPRVFAVYDVTGDYDSMVLRLTPPRIDHGSEASHPWMATSRRLASISMVMAGSFPSFHLARISGKPCS